AYSAVVQPSPLPWRQRGTPSVKEAAHSTRVRPNSTRTLPSAWSSQPRVKRTSRSWSGARPSWRGEVMAHRVCALPPPAAYRSAHWPVRTPVTVLGRPSFVGGGVFCRQVRTPSMVFSARRMARSPVALSCRVTDPPTTLPSRTRPAVTWRAVTGPPSCESVTSTLPARRAVTAPPTVASSANRPPPPLTVTGPSTWDPAARQARPPLTVSGPACRSVTVVSQVASVTVSVTGTGTYGVDGSSLLTHRVTVWSPGSIPLLSR